MPSGCRHKNSIYICGIVLPVENGMHLLMQVPFRSRIFESSMCVLENLASDRTTDLCVTNHHTTQTALETMSSVYIGDTTELYIAAFGCSR